ncbi:hypothetical protein [Desertivirga arenae]|uniref:hypothetical protein n=1 Tax=Desertivirga arenae TaxID=2810309 RepID=UPI001A97514C|nr:hypothetical protein [Pedobacter sp. SYSU D00823]
MNKLFFLILILLDSFAGKGQDFKGLWHGYITGEGLLNHSEYTLDVKTQDDNVLTGKAYLYSTQLFVFQGIFDFIGKVDRNVLKLTELKILKKEMPDEKYGLCIKYENVRFSKDTCEYLTGKWGNTKGNCPPGEVFLKRITLGKANTVKIPNAVYSKILLDTSKDIFFLNTTLAKPIILDVHQFSIEITIKDYLKEDYDTVSVYLNRQEIIKDHRISNKPFTKKVKLDLLSGMNEIVVYAKNLGIIPPNTCTMIVYDGYKRQKVNITSDRQNSAAIYLNYSLPNEMIYQNNTDVVDELRRMNYPRVNPATSKLF